MDDEKYEAKSNSDRIDNVKIEQKQPNTINISFTLKDEAKVKVNQQNGGTETPTVSGGSEEETYTASSGKGEGENRSAVEGKSKGAAGGEGTSGDTQTANNSVDDEEPYSASENQDDTPDTSPSEASQESPESLDDSSNVSDAPSQDSDSGKDETTNNQGNGSSDGGDATPENQPKEGSQDGQNNESGESKENNQENPEGKGDKPENKEENAGNKESDNQNDDPYKANENKDNPEEANAPENNKPKPNPNEGRGAAPDDKPDGTKDRIDKARNNKQRNNGSKDTQKAGEKDKSDDKKEGSDDKKDGESSDKKDKDGNNGDKPNNNAKNGKGNPSLDPQKQLAEKRKKIIENGKKAIKEGKATSSDARKYASLKPGEYLKDVGKQKLKTLFLAHPFICIIIALGIVVVAFIGIFIGALMMSPGSTRLYNRYDYTQVTAELKDRVKSEKIYIHEATLGAAYKAFFINTHIYDKNLSEVQLQNIFALYYLYTKTTILKSPRNSKYHYDATKSNYDYTVQINSGTNDWLSYCDPYSGCNTSWGDYITCSEDDNNCKYKGLYEYETGSKMDFNSDVLTDVANALYDYIAAPFDKNDTVTKIDSNFGVNNISKNMFNKMIDFASDSDNASCIKSIINSNGGINIDYLNNMLSIMQSGSSSDNKCLPSSNSVKAYNIKDYVIDDEVAYIDVGFWWPVGSTSLGSDNLYSGTPAYTRISSPFGWRNNDDGELVYHSGIDIPTGGIDDKIPVLAVGKGTVTGQGCVPYKGYCGFNQTSLEFSEGGCSITITHDNGLVTKYLHLSKQSYNAFVKKYDTVERGQQIARIGSTGCSTGPHLHFTIKENGKEINPLNYISVNNPRSTKQ